MADPELRARLHAANTALRAGLPLSSTEREALDDPEYRLAVYGTLRPGHSNHALLAQLGDWEPAWVHGQLGTWRGYPILIPDSAGPRVDADLLHSARLSERWSELDAFEGPAYRRDLVLVEHASGWTIGHCYVDARVEDRGAPPPTAS